MSTIVIATLVLILVAVVAIYNRFVRGRNRVGDLGGQQIELERVILAGEPPPLHDQDHPGPRRDRVPGCGDEPGASA